MPRHQPPFTGIWPAMVTPFDADDQLNLDAARRLIARYLEQGAGGIYLCGSTGEAPLLSIDERKRLAEFVISEVAGQIPVIVQVGHGSPTAALELARHARKCGADAISSIRPLFFPYGDAQVADYWAGLSREADLPFYAYVMTDIGGTYGQIAAWFEQIRRIPTLAGVKFTNPDSYQLSVLRVVAGPGFNIFSGCDECYLASKVSGADAAIGSSYNFALPLWRKVMTTYEAGDRAGAERLMLRCAELIARMRDSRYFTRLKLVLKRQGLDCGLPRPPLCDMAGITDEETDIIVRLASVE
ncbi:MAG TPA: dihydrodipicolinate synthase family protein [Phycisphaerae bacterium]|jgi:N-acetylneuraminate lyase|nr:hypothetical protein [Phycisphaerae bacterium]HOB73010.1 dihydrodipicolinate synthase family protein [Phycisphaerae bacterium]HOJ52941.1 dihydrodipicolinate synthase family protein [Phycisphaerae bacterium]HOL24678.1 dihydrodipicolinate synthase family protein [Phycisphaerae bacterium]HPP19214.1 dihydrodipicolinate synthase family protein [Phycisphaerae bacterium]